MSGWAYAEGVAALAGSGDKTQAPPPDLISLAPNLRISIFLSGMRGWPTESHFSRPTLSRRARMNCTAGRAVRVQEDGQRLCGKARVPAVR